MKTQSRMTLDGRPVSPTLREVISKALTHGVEVIPVGSPKSGYIINGHVRAVDNKRVMTPANLVNRCGWKYGVITDFPQVASTIPEGLHYELPVGTRIYGDGRAKALKYGAKRFAA